MIRSTISTTKDSATSSHRTNTPSGLKAIRQLLKNPLNFLVETALQQEGIARLDLGFAQMYLVSWPDDLQYVLRDNHRNFGKRGGLWAPIRTLVGNSLVTSEGTSWLRKRRMIQSQFHRQRLTALSTIITNSIARRLKSWKSLIDTDRPVDMGKEMKGITITVIVNAMFGSSIKPNEIVQVSRAMRIVLSHITKRTLLFFLPKWLPIPGDRPFRKAIRQIDEVLYRVINERHRAVEDHEDLLSMLLDARDEETGEGMSDQQLRDEVITIFLGGYETTATALAWVWYALAKNPDVERKVFAEVDEVLADRAPTFTDLPRLTYSKMVIQETLRLYPPAWMYTRDSIEEDEVGGCHIPANAMMFILPYATHLNPDLWDEPERFDPERFTPERSAARPRFAYMPFGGGPRLCIGEHFAMMEAQLILVMVAQLCRVQLSGNRTVEPMAAATLQPRGDILTTLHSRQLEWS